MIGVVASDADLIVAREFFELFKTPWEPWRDQGQYDVVLQTGSRPASVPGAKLVLLFSGRQAACDSGRAVQAGVKTQGSCILSYRGLDLPIYGDAVTFPEGEDDVLVEKGSRRCAAYLCRSGETCRIRIGYDLFAEVRALLTEGQPPANASSPALELHITLLRDLITGSGLPLVEIPPVPEGHSFVACLTHDVDHPAIRAHKFDHTLFGFLYRALFRSTINALRGRTTWPDLLANWAAAFRLPLVHLGLAKDFWREFDDRYLTAEAGCPSTFFVIPFKNTPGRNTHGPAPRFRAARSEAREIAGAIQKLQAAGCEVGLHGIDAWCDSARGRAELEEIRGITGTPDVGVRMHWLYFDPQSPAMLELAGAAYDSTMGYNETVGYRAGTTQVYKPLQASRLLELPLHLMDTALFYPSHMALSPEEAGKLAGRMVDRTAQFGGLLTVNWHDRSLAPERLWHRTYAGLIGEMKKKGAWFATARQAVAWFQHRRSAAFQAVSPEPGGVRARVAVPAAGGLPGLRLRVHKPRREATAGVAPDFSSFVDVNLRGDAEIRVAF